ncbi:hypothetical protein GCM10009759_53340 [Kitasatospora saccharophila]|uniref:Uncharacterized protein n=1 Tax=Kitasatospora saccharophila TaxID=407973 RepID=A0ABN2XJ20_9ACTN
MAEAPVRAARRPGLPVIEVDGSRDAPAVAALAAERFAPWPGA